MKSSSFYQYLILRMRTHPIPMKPGDILSWISCHLTRLLCLLTIGGLLSIIISGLLIYRSVDFLNKYWLHFFNEICYHFIFLRYQLANFLEVGFMIQVRYHLYHQCWKVPALHVQSIRKVAIILPIYPYSGLNMGKVIRYFILCSFYNVIVIKNKFQIILWIFKNGKFYLLLILNS